MAEPTVTKVDLAGVEATHYEWPGVIRPDYETPRVQATKRLRAYLDELDEVREDLAELKDKPSYQVNNVSNVFSVLNLRQALDALDDFERALRRVVGRGR